MGASVEIAVVSSRRTGNARKSRELSSEQHFEVARRSRLNPMSCFLGELEILRIKAAAVQSVCPRV